MLVAETEHFPEVVRQVVPAPTVPRSKATSVVPEKETDVLSAAGVTPSNSKTEAVMVIAEAPSAT